MMSMSKAIVRFFICYERLNKLDIACCGIDANGLALGEGGDFHHKC
jgi:hypothetical protein